MKGGCAFNVFPRQLWPSGAPRSPDQRILFPFPPLGHQHSVPSARAIPDVLQGVICCGSLFISKKLPQALGSPTDMSSSRQDPWLGTLSSPPLRLESADPSASPPHAYPSSSRIFWPPLEQQQLGVTDLKSWSLFKLHVSQGS